MSLSYPPTFPKPLLRAVVAVQARAEPGFREALRQIPVHHHRGGHSAPDRQAYRELSAAYIRKLVLSFSHQACQAARVETISLDAVTWYIDEFIRHATVHAYFDFDLRRAWGRWESFRDDMDPAIFESDGWRDHKSELATVAEGLVGTDAARLQQGDGASPPSEPVGSVESVEPGVENLTWGSMRFRFIDEHTVQVTIGDRLQPPQGYEKMGFADGRTKNPKLAWKALLELAKLGGTISTVPKFCDWARDWKSLEKRMEELRKTLRKHFKVDADPLPFKPKDLQLGLPARYEAIFRIDGSALDTDN